MLVRSNLPQYVILSDHSPESCPSANKAVREFVLKSFAGMEKLAEKHRVRPQIALHLDPGHKVVQVVEAPSIEAVRDMVYESGYSEWNDTTVYPTTPVDELVKRISEFTPIY